MGNPYRHISNCMNIFIHNLPEEQKKKVFIDRKIKRVYQQFSQCVDPYILDHVNSVYLIEEASDVSRETQLILTVYVDNSLVAAELNAQRELILLKYRELFNLTIAVFDIKISRGSYLKNHPFKKEELEKKKTFHHLSPQEEDEINTLVSRIKDDEIKKSFQRVLKAIKEHPSQE